MAPYLVALTALGTEAEARLLVRQLVGDRVVACGTVVPGATSVFRWAGEVTESNEVIVLLKTRRERWSALEAAIRERHPYDVPELLALPVEAGLPAYLEWVATETSEAP
ncbi:MAG TPA: divalent-cation tolerance protein CutA [Gemmatimonadales bacterium]|nr:divalent-cation tolerance protein CutA [Gemmatimonadales bacterium]